MDNNNLKPTILLHLGLASAFAILTAALTDLTVLIFPNIGWHFLTVLYILIVLAQILFYFLTTYTNVWLAILSFILNFVLWTAEQVNLESTFHDTFFYQDKNFRYAVIVLGGLLWGTNKLLLDKIFERFNFKMRASNRLDNLWTSVTKKQSTNR